MASNSSTRIIGANRHGKGAVRVVKVIRNGSRHTVREIKAKVLVSGPVDSAYEHGDNSVVLPTDTVKNTVYALARKTNFENLEDFAVVLARHFLERHPSIMTGVDVTLEEAHWERVACPDSNGRIAEHNHGFQRGAEPRWCNVAGSLNNLTLTSGFTEAQILKTTQTGFEGFARDEFTTLAEARDRLMGTKLTASWTYSSTAGGNFDQLAKDIKATLVSTFMGPADTGIYSKSVQETLHLMAEAVLSRFRNVTSIKMSAPNVHNLPVDLSKFGLTNNNDILMPIDEPHGWIEAEFTQPRSRL